MSTDGRTDGRIDGRTDGQKDGYGETGIPPTTSLRAYTYLK
jgi:hypothetical protein